MCPPSPNDLPSTPDGVSRVPAAAGLQAYPELDAVLTLAVAAVAEAFDVDQEAEPARMAALERAATAAVVEFYAPVVELADRLAAAAELPRAAQAEAVAQTAELLAVRGDAAAAALQARGNGEAGLHRRDETVAARAARTASAARLARSAQIAAAEVAEAAETAADQVAAEVSEAAAAVRAAALDTCYQLALVAAADVACAPVRAEAATVAEGSRVVRAC